MIEIPEELLIPCQWHEYPLANGMTVKWLVRPGNPGRQESVNVGNQVIVDAEIILPAGGGLESICFGRRLGSFCAEELTTKWGGERENGRCKKLVQVGPSWRYCLEQMVDYILYEIRRLDRMIKERTKSLKSEGWELVMSAIAFEEKPA